MVRAESTSEGIVTQFEGNPALVMAETVRLIQDARGKVSRQQWRFICRELQIVIDMENCRNEEQQTKSA